MDDELVERVAETSGLTRAEASRLVDDVVTWYREPFENYVRRRHEHLRTYGVRNAEIYARLAVELRGRVVAAPDLTERQLRRIIYG